LFDDQFCSGYGKRTRIRIRTYEKRFLIKCLCFCITHLLSVISAHFPENYHHLMFIIDSFLNNKNKKSSVYFFFFHIFLALLHRVHAIQFYLVISCSCHHSEIFQMSPSLSFANNYAVCSFKVFWEILGFSFQQKIQLQFQIHISVRWTQPDTGPISAPFFLIGK
jgi:hypothetical protein